MASPEQAAPPHTTRRTDGAASTPPLQGGDRLTRPEFERRYTAMPHLKKAELIEGRVYMPSPVRNQSHGRPHAHLIGWLAAYAAATPGVELSADATVRLDWFGLAEGAYRVLAPDADGLLEGDLSRVMGEARAGTETENHAAFVQQLETRREA